MSNKIQYKIGLESDFRDYYDHWFTPQYQHPNKVLKRIANSQSWSKREQLQFLETIGKTPFNRVVRELPSFLDQKLVVYVNEYSHRGEGKVLLEFEEALEKYPEKYASVYIEQESGSTTSFRLLQIGDSSWWLKYQSSDNWRSNVGDVTVEVEGESSSGWEDIQRNVEPLKDYPLFAIDFVQSIAGHLYAIDFNTAPGLSGTGMEELLKGKEVFELIAEHYLRA